MDVTWPLVGRQAELEVLSAALADTRAGGVVLAGEAGIGKTRLAREALARAEAAGLEVEWLAATRAAASIPFGAVSHLLPLAERPPTASSRSWTSSGPSTPVSRWC